MTEIIKETIIDPNNQDKEIKIEITQDFFTKKNLSNDNVAKNIIKQFQEVKHILTIQCLNGDFINEEYYNKLIEIEKISAQESLSIIFGKDALKCIAWFDRLEM